MEAGAHTPSASLLAAISVVTLIGMIGGALFWKRRHKFPLDGRESSFVLVTEGLFIVSGVTRMADEIVSEDFPCGVQFFSLHRGLLHLTIVLVRMYRVWHLFNSSKVLLELHRKQRHAKMSVGFIEKVEAHNMDGTDVDVSPSGIVWQKNEVKMRDTRKLWSIVLLVTLFDSTMLFILFFAEPSSCDLRYSGIYHGARVATTIVTLVLVSSKVQGIPDGFFIRDEFKMIGILGAISLPLILLEVLQVAPMDIPLWLVGRSFGLVQLYYPLWKSYGLNCVARASSKSRLSIEATQETELEDVLTDPKYQSDRRDLEDYFVREFAIENLIFVDAVREFRAMYPTFTDEQVATSALAIFYRFVIKLSNSQINVSDAVRDTVAAAIQANVSNFDNTSTTRTDVPVVSGRIAQEVFDEPYDHIMNLMKRDTFMRWRIVRFGLDAKEATSSAKTSPVSV